MTAPLPSLGHSSRIELAARALYESVLLPFLHVQEGEDVVASGRCQSWDTASEQTRRSYAWKAQKAFESETFEAYCGWMTLAERMAAESPYLHANGEPPAADADTERTRAHRAEYHLVHHLVRVDDVAPLGEGSE